MNTQKYTSLLARPQDISAEEVKELDAILEAYPYFGPPECFDDLKGRPRVMKLVKQ